MADYERFAEVAEREGHVEIAALLRELAGEATDDLETSLEPGSTEDNLKAAIEAEVRNGSDVDEAGRAAKARASRLTAALESLG
ncbi:MAG TPA: hypothetical protein VEA78_04570 [Acidimicrobiales bacterium]|nr:hypothetical protein [Acidimicrobiales bacterium]